MLVAMVPFLTMAQKRTKKGKDTKIETAEKSSDAKATFMILKGVEIDMFEMDQVGMDQKEIEDRKRSDITLDGMIQRHSNPSSSFHFSYDIGGNKTNNEIGKIFTFSEFANLFGAEIPETGQVNINANKIVYDDALAELLNVEVKKEDSGNKFYINDELSPDLNFSSNKTYVFDQNDETTSKHPLSISITKNGVHEEGSSIQNIKFFANGYNKSEDEYSTIFSNDENFDNAFVVYTPSSDDNLLYYYCLFHSGMANDAKILVDGFEEETITASLDISNNGASDFLISNKNDPTLTLERGKTYEFDVNSPGHPFWIKTTSSSGTGNSYMDGISNNGASNGIIKFKVPQDSPDQLYYNCQFHSSMNGIIYIVDNNSSGVIITDTSSNSNTGGGYGYGYDLILTYNSIEIPPISYDI